MTATASLLPPNADADELVESVHRTMKSVFRHLSPALGDEGISMGQFWTLHTISSLDVAPLGAIARGLGVSSPTLCATVDELEAAGFVARHRSDKDRRVVELSLTPKGRRTESRIWVRVGGLMGVAARDLPPEDLKTAIRVFRTIYRQLDAGPATVEVRA
jgi:MarR family transcriptional regulator, organic hydroperoxide resistance regulator